MNKLLSADPGGVEKQTENNEPTKTSSYNGFLSALGHRNDIAGNIKTSVVTVSGEKTKTIVAARKKKIRKFYVLVVVIPAFLIAIAIFAAIVVVANIEGCADKSRKICLTEECVRTASQLLSAMDRNMDPCKDFFQYACGTWNKKHLIPEDRSSISTFEVMADQLQLILKVLEKPMNLEDNDATRKAKMFYGSCMDIYHIRKIGDVPLKEVLKDLGGWPVTLQNWTVPENMSVEILLGKIRGVYNEGILIEQWVGPDDKNSSVNIIQIDQMQLALPSRDYYLKSVSKADLNAYHTYMTNIAGILHANKTYAVEELKKVIDFEIALANASIPEADRHDTSVIYRKLSIDELQRVVPQIDWLKYFNSFLGTTIDKNEPVVVYGLSYFIEMGKILAKTDIRVIHNYVLWRLIMPLSSHMMGDYQKERVEFRKILQGVLSERHRWSQCVEWTNKKLGMAVGALFVKDNFNHESKETALVMIHTIREAFNELLSHNEWMDDETRAVAKEKADAMNERIGYPKLITDKEKLVEEYNLLNITKHNFMQNVLNILKFEADQNMMKLRQPVDRDKWATEPAVVNAFYNPNKNDIVFPAGILQPLFYSQHFPKSLNYGGIGVVIGHEITHGFDDKGRQFDKDGNMMQWWNNATIKAFRERTQCIIDQYSRYRIEEVGLYIDGRMTQGENIADNGGLKQAFRAYQKWVSVHGEEPDLPGLNLTHNQLFFLNYAQIWCGSMRPEDALTKIRSSVHSPGPIRVLGPLSNSYDFAKAFNCPPGTPMNPTDKCSVW